jgi:hypothetical protein
MFPDLAPIGLAAVICLLLAPMLSGRTVSIGSRRLAVSKGDALSITGVALAVAFAVTCANYARLGSSGYWQPGDFRGSTLFVVVNSALALAVAPAVVTLAVVLGWRRHHRTEHKESDRDQR